MWIKQLHTHRLFLGFQRAFAWLVVATLVLACNSPIRPRSAPNMPEMGMALKIQSETSSQVNVEQAFGKLPLYFVENQGQTDERVAYYIQGSDKTLYFTPKGVTFALTRPATDVSIHNHTSREAVRNSPARDDAHKHLSTPPYSRWAVKLDFVGANPNVRPMGQDQTEAIISYFKGQPDEWRTGLHTYHRLVYPDLWPGIDLVYYGTVNQLKYEFIVKPGADPAQIQLAYRGATDVSLNDAGQMEVTTPLGGFADDTPMAYQDIDGERVPVTMAYALEEQSPLALLNSTSLPHSLRSGSSSFGGYSQQSDIQNPKSYGFRVGDYDPTRPLVLDPAVLVYAGYIGGASIDYGDDIVVDGAGNAYVTGGTTSDETTFPVAGGPDLTFNSVGGVADAFVAKVNAAGTALVYAGYIGGGGTDSGSGIAVDGAGNAYITGYTNGGLPVTGGPDLTYNGGTYDAFVAKVNATGTALVYAGYIGGSNSDFGNGIAVDVAGNAYLIGTTNSDQTTFLVTGGPDLIYNGGSSYGDAFVAKVNAAGTALVYAGYIGGSSNDGGDGIAVDGAGNAYVTGRTSSDQATFPVIGGPDLTYNGSSNDAFIAKVNTAGTALVYAGYIGGASDDYGYGIAVDSAGNAYVTGDTTSDQTAGAFPVTSGPDLTFNGSTDAFVAKVNPTGTAFVYAGYIGGSGSDGGSDIAVDDAGNVYVTGSTSSDETAGAFPVTGGPDLTYNGGTSDAFVAKVNAAGMAPLVYAGYIGGSGSDGGSDIAVDDAGNVYVTGSTSSDETAGAFPVTGGPDLTYNNGVDAFVAKVSVAASANVDAYVSVPALVGAPPAGVAALPIQFGNNGATTAMSVTLTATLGISLTYLSDTSGLTPTVVSNTISWSLPDLPLTYIDQFTLYVTVPSAPFGDRYPITLVLDSAGPEDNASDNLANVEVMIARQLFLPLIHR